MPYQVPHPLAPGDLQFLLKLRQHLFQIGLVLLGLCHRLVLFSKVTVQLFQHAGGVVLDLSHIGLQQLVQLVHPDVMAGTGFQAAPVVLDAAVGVPEAAAAHGEHWGAAAATLQEAGVHVVVLLLAPVVGGGADLP